MLLLEFSLNRIFHHYRHTSGMAVVSADRPERSDAENAALRPHLEAHLRSLGKAFVPMRGKGYVDSQTGKTVTGEFSYAVPNVNKEEAKALSQHLSKSATPAHPEHAFNQDSIMWAAKGHGASYLYGDTGREEHLGNKFTQQKPFGSIHKGKLWAITDPPPGDPYPGVSMESAYGIACGYPPAGYEWDVDARACVKLPTVCDAPVRLPEAAAEPNPAGPAPQPAPQGPPPVFTLQDVQAYVDMGLIHQQEEARIIAQAETKFGVQGLALGPTGLVIVTGAMEQVPIDTTGLGGYGGNDGNTDRERYPDNDGQVHTVNQYPKSQTT